jgi:hypothetical protein
VAHTRRLGGSPGLGATQSADIPHRKSESGRGTEKPVECVRRPIENNSSPGQAVYEPFSGSGTTIIAAEMTGRSCHAIELSPAYVDVAIQRWQAFTGANALLEGASRPFAEVAADRAAAHAVEGDLSHRTQDDRDPILSAAAAGAFPLGGGL